jgi:membrane fusion protein (multidrug efflux system)
MVHFERWIVGKAIKIILGFCVIALFVAGGAFGTQMLLGGDDAESSERDPERQPTRVGVASPEMRDIEDDISAVGTLRPLRAVDIVPNVAGRVTQVPVSSGQDVSEGDLLIQLDDRAARAALAEAEATLSEAEQEYRRYQQLEDSNAAAEARLEEARGAFRRAEASMTMAEAALEDRRITAPFAGTLGVIDTEPGAFLDASEAVTRLADLSSVEASVTLPERYFDKVFPGQTLEVSTPAYPDTTFEGHLVLRSPQIDLGTRSFEIRAQIDNADGRLVGGMFANSRLVLDTYEGMAIPDDAIISEGLTSYVYTVANGSAARTEIEVGATLGQLTEVRDGLDDEARVVVAGWDQLTDGAPVEVDENFTQEGLE